ncbi:MAG: alpha/beta hydrolase [Psychrosphaera sp.]|nr:alpha/beta hydrolase [Psychrosphaera sp.]
MIDLVVENHKKRVGAKRVFAGFIVMLMLAGTNASADELVVKEAFVQRPDAKLYTRQICPQKQDSPARQLVFSHGLTYSSHEFDVDVKDYSLARFFARQGYCVWLFDVTGYGQSSRPTDGFSVDTNSAAQDLKAVVAHVRKTTKVDKVSLFGWSWGTVVAARMASNKPDWVKNMVLYAPIYIRLGSTPPKAAWHENTWRHAASDFQQVDSGQGKKGTIDYDIVEEVVAATFLSNSWRFDGHSSPNGGRRDLLTSGNKALFDMKKLLGPVLLIGGSKDPLLNWPKLNEGFAQIAQRPGNKLIKIEGGSHILMLEKPHYQTFRNHALTFINQTWAL